MESIPTSKQVSLRVRLSSVAERIVRQGHPWVFADSIKSQNRPAQSGELALIFDRHDTFMALGLHDPDSPIRIRVLHVGKPVRVEPAWWQGRLEQSLSRRVGLFDEKNTGLRLIHGESDGWPGLVLDRYENTLVLKLYTSAWFPHLPMLQTLFQQTLQPERLILRLSRNIQEAAARHSLQDGRILFGENLEGSVIFKESDLKLYADVIKGQKTGFFLDQRENRRRVETLAQGRRVLNLFSFSGGFSLYAARGGASHVSSVDISAHALAELKRNWEANQDQNGILNCPHTEIQADVFSWLEQCRDTYDLIVIDPPSLAKREKEREGALKAYERLIQLGLARLNSRGVLVAASCSAHVSSSEFFECARHCLRQEGRVYQELETSTHAPDHPISIPEMAYLKAIYFRLSC
ncbi:MAG: class I SAM-dependent rRNA methyltransferase [Blastochloris sp.]|nr:class I SAM-dependent rRNA methyltransferase [Blastochloris sp.]